MTSTVRFFRWTSMLATILILAGCLNSPTPTPTPYPVLAPSPTSTVQPSDTPAPTRTWTPTLVPTPTRTITPSPTAFNPSVKVVGTEEVVFNWKRDQCIGANIPDLPVRVFRDADGMIQLNLSFTSNFRMMGKDLDSLKVDCNKPTLVSDLDPDPGHYNYSEWMGSPYTLDGKTVYALIHNEWYGNVASRWQAGRDFGAGQGENNWYYRYWNGSRYGDMRFDAANNRWQASDPLCQIGATGMHPDRACEPARTWVSPVDATVTISGSIRDSDPGGGDGVIVKILKGDAELWSVTIDNGDVKDYPYNLEVPVRVGDPIYFRVNARGNANYDTTNVNPKINIGADPCPSGRQGLCTVYSVTFGKSTDGGKTFTHSSAPSHLVAALPYRYQPDGGMFGMWQPSNIVKHPRDGYYYVMVQLDDNRVGRTWYQGMCALRTKTLDDPTSWRAWDGKGFDLRFINPYAETVADPAKNPCQIVSPNEVGGALTYNLTYNSFFDKFMAVGVDVHASVPGFYFSLSDDLVNWTPRKLIMPALLINNTGGKTPFSAYPALVDPADTSRNFEVVGANPYLYFTRANKLGPNDYDLLRVRVQFSK